MGEAKRRKKLDPTWGKPKKSKQIEEIPVQELAARIHKEMMETPVSMERLKGFLLSTVYETNEIFLIIHQGTAMIPEFSINPNEVLAVSIDHIQIKLPHESKNVDINQEYELCIWDEMTRPDYNFLIDKFTGTQDGLYVFDRNFSTESLEYTLFQMDNDLIEKCNQVLANSKSEEKKS